MKHGGKLKYAVTLKSEHVNCGINKRKLRKAYLHSECVDGGEGVVWAGVLEVRHVLDLARRPCTCAWKIKF